MGYLALPYNGREQLRGEHKDGVKRIHDRELSNHCKDNTSRYKPYRMQKRKKEKLIENVSKEISITVACL